MSELNKTEAIKTIAESYRLNEPERKALIASIIEAPVLPKVDSDTALEVEKYRIDKLIENGLIKEQSQETISRNKIYDNFFEIIKDAKFWYFLMFIAFMFNSNNFWKYMLKALELGGK